MTEAEYKTLHIELWQWLYDNPGKPKQAWPGWEEHEDSIHRCFACDFASDCVHCPLDKEIMRGCNPYLKHSKAGAFLLWCESNYCDTEAAALIRDAWREIPS
jgi:hypothetical protein